MGDTALRLWSMGIRNNSNASYPMMSTSSGISRTPAGVLIGMGLQHILRELYYGHPASSRHVDGTDDLHVSWRNIVYTDSPIGITSITLLHT
jgi:hypothetical protein